MIAGLSFALEPATGLIVTGPNGIGKSTLLRTLAGLIDLSEGTIDLQGMNPDHMRSDYCHYFGHQNAVKPALSALENLSFWQSMTVSPASDGFKPETCTCEEALDLLGLAHAAELPAAYLSAGQTRRLSFARLLVSPRPIWLLDEPSSALDGASEKTLVALMEKHLVAGGSLIAATHIKLPVANSQFLHLSQSPEVSSTAGETPNGGDA